MNFLQKLVFIINLEEPDSPRTTYDCKIPAPPKLDLNANQDGPPALPVHLQKVLLNSKSISAHDPYLLPLPNHVSVNHLYACSIRDGVMAIGSTFRYRKKVIFG
jgi:5'-AMP-activated protein kinase regulatory beta subunit